MGKEQSNCFSIQFWPFDSSQQTPTEVLTTFDWWWLKAPSNYNSQISTISYRFGNSIKIKRNGQMQSFKTTGLMHAHVLVKMADQNEPQVLTLGQIRHNLFVKSFCKKSEIICRNQNKFCEFLWQYIGVWPSYHCLATTQSVTTCFDLKNCWFTFNISFKTASDWPWWSASTPRRTGWVMDKSPWIPGRNGIYGNGWVMMPLDGCRRGWHNWRQKQLSW